MSKQLAGLQEGAGLTEKTPELIDAPDVIDLSF
jgi:hypothetical protein